MNENSSTYLWQGVTLPKQKAIKFNDGTNTKSVTVSAPPTISTDWSLFLPIAEGLNNQGLITDGAGQLSFVDIVLSSDNRLWAENTLVVKKNAGYGEYSTLNSAIAAAGVLSPTVTSPCCIYIYPGTYQEPELTIPANTYIAGISQGAVIIVPLTPNQNLFNFGMGTGMANIVVRDVGVGYYALNFVDVGVSAVVTKCSIFNCGAPIYIRSTATGSCEVYLDSVDCTMSLGLETVVEIDSDPAGDGIFVSADNFSIFTDGISNPAVGVHIHGDGAEFYMQGAAFFGISGDNTGIGLLVEDGGIANARGWSLMNFGYGIQATDDAGTPSIIIIGGNINAAVRDVNILSATATGYFSGVSAFSRTYINDASTFFIVDKNLQMVSVAKRGGDFTSIKSALNGITDNTASKRYLIMVGPGTYVEDNSVTPITLKSYITVRGLSNTDTIVVASDNSKTLLTGAPDATLVEITLGFTASHVDNPSLITYTGALTPGLTVGIFRVLQCRFSGFPYRVMDITSSVSSPALVFVDDSLPLVNSQFSYFMRLTQTASSACQAYVGDFVWNPVAVTPLVRLFDISGPQVGLVCDGVQCRQTSAVGEYLHLENGATIQLANSTASKFQTVISCPDVGAGPIIRASSLTCYDCTTDISILNPAASGSIMGLYSSSKIVLSDPEPSVTFNFTDPQTGDSVIIGEIYQGTQLSNLTRMSPAMQNSFPTGLISGGQLTNNGTTVSVSDGYGYLSRLADDLFTFVQWTSVPAITPGTSTDGQYLYIFADEDNTVSASASPPNPYHAILIGTMQVASNGDILWLQEVSQDAVHPSTTLDHTLRNAIGPLFQSGCLVTENATTPFALDVSTGRYYFGVHSYSPSASTEASFLECYRNASGVFQFVTNSPSLVQQAYDNGIGLVALTAGQFAKHTLYIAGDGTKQILILLYGQELFATFGDALSGNSPTPPQTSTASLALENMASLASIIVEGGAGSISANPDAIVDIRPRLGFSSPSNSPSIVHGDLLGLIEDDHPQYLLVDGSRPMNGTLQMSTHDIAFSSPGTGVVDGVTVAAHASRHIPSGEDPLPTADVSEIASVGASNSAGILNNFSRGDHVHAHGVQLGGNLHAAVTTSTNGFMTAADKLKLDNATNSATPSTIVMRDSSGSSSFANVNIVGQNSLSLQDLTSNTVSLRAPSTVTSSYTLTLPSAVGTGGQVLTLANSTGILSWVSAGFVDPLTTDGDMMTRVASATTRLPIGDSANELTVVNDLPAWTDLANRTSSDVKFVDDFMSAPTALWTSTVASGGTITANSPTTIDNSVGVVRLQLALQLSSRAQLSQALNLALGYGVLTWTCRVQIDSNPLLGLINQYTAYLGLGDVVGAGNHNNGVYFRYGVGLLTSNWECVTASGGTRTILTTSSSPSLNTWYRLKIQTTSTSSPTVTFSIDDVVVGSTALNVPTSNRIGLSLKGERPAINLALSLANIFVDYVTLEYAHNTSR